MTMQTTTAPRKRRIDGKFNISHERVIELRELGLDGGTSAPGLTPNGERILERLFLALDRGFQKRWPNPIDREPKPAGAKRKRSRSPSCVERRRRAEALIASNPTIGTTAAANELRISTSTVHNIRRELGIVFTPPAPKRDTLKLKLATLVAATPGMTNRAMARQLDVSENYLAQLRQRWKAEDN